MKPSVYWTDQVPRPEDIPLSELPVEADVAIIGSGYTGFNAAIVLAKAGAMAVVLEQETIGWGASSRNGSMLTPGLKADLKDIERWYGKEKAQYLWQWSVDAFHYVENTIREENIDCDFEKNGLAYLAAKPSHAEGVRGYGELLAGIRQTSEFLEIKHPRKIFARLDPVYLPVVSQYFKIRDAIS